MPAVVAPSHKKVQTKKSPSTSTGIPTQPSAMRTRQSIKKELDTANDGSENGSPKRSKDTTKTTRAHFSKEEKQDESRPNDKRHARHPTPKRTSVQHTYKNVHADEGDEENSIIEDGSLIHRDQAKRVNRKKRFANENNVDASLASNESLSQSENTDIPRRRTGQDHNRKRDQGKATRAIGRKMIVLGDSSVTNKEEDSFVTEAATFDNAPKASSPIGPIKSHSPSVERRKSVSEKKEGGKVHRGIVAEMYEHERRLARANDPISGSNRPRSGTEVNRSLSSHFGQSPAAINTPISPLAFGLPGIANPLGGNSAPQPDASLSPFGISPYAEPGTSWTTNVYVNNLPPHTSDEDLLRLGSCFGRVKSHKAIINQETGLCKGYGFIMYEFLHDAELAIQQLPLHGLATSWAKESFSSKLRRMADSTTSNVYLSNLPQDITPNQLEQLFSPHEVISLRILTDGTSGKPRGVGFVRLRDRHVAHECIERLNGMVFPNQETPLQARFADSEAQKQFKHCARAQLSKGDDSGEQSEETEHKSGVNLNHGQKTTLKNETSTPAFAAALKHGNVQHTWTGFATPASQAGGFSPLVGFMSPAFNAGFQPSAPAAFSPQVGALPGFLTPDAFVGGFAYDSVNNLIGRNDQQISNQHMMSDTAINQRIDWLAAAQQHYGQQQARLNNELYNGHHFADGFTVGNPLGVHPVAFPSGLSAWPKPRNGSVNNGRAKPIAATYLPPDLALQHARALMEKSTQHHAAMASNTQSNTTLNSGLTQQHVEHERADLLKMLKEASDNLAKLRTSQQQHENHVSKATEKHANEVKEDNPKQEPVENSLGLSNILNLPTLDSDHENQASRRKSSNPQSYFGMTPSKSTPTIGSNGSSSATAIAPVRASLSATSLSPLRFLYSKDPNAPISVEAVDMSKTHGGEDGYNHERENDRVPTPMPGSSQKEASALHGDGGTEDHPSTVQEEEKENTTNGESEPNDSSYTSAATTTSNHDEEEKEDIKGRDGIVGQDAFQHSSHPTEDPKDGMVVKLISNINLPPPHSVMMFKNAPATQNSIGTGRNRSKSVVIHAPFDDVPVSPSQASGEEIDGLVGMTES